MTDPALVYDDIAEAGEIPVETGHDVIPLSDPDVTLAEIRAVDAVLRSPRLSSGPLAEELEAAFAAYVGGAFAIAGPDRMRVG